MCHKMSSSHTLLNAALLMALVALCLFSAIFCSIGGVDSAYKDIITQTGGRHCYERYGALQAEQFYQLSSGKTAMYLCGAVRFCETSPCYTPIYGNNSVYVSGRIGDYERIITYGDYRMCTTCRSSIGVACALLGVMLISFMYECASNYLNSYRQVEVDE